MSIAVSLIILSVVITMGITLGRVKIFGVSLGVTWILFIGIIFSHFGYTLSPEVLHFAKEFGLILFVYSIGMQVGPGLFTSYRGGGFKLNLLAAILVLSGVIVTCLLIFITGIKPAVMVGVMSGAVTNTPGLGAAQQAFADAFGGDPSIIAQGYAVSYPLGVVGCILSFILLKAIFKPETSTPEISVRETAQLSDNQAQRIIALSKIEYNGTAFADMHFDKLGVSVRNVRRAGIDISPKADLILQLGDFLTVAGTDEALLETEKLLGNSTKKLGEPNLASIFFGIALGCIIGSIPFHFPGIPQPIKLGLAGGPLIVSILLSRFGPRIKVISYATVSANLIVREIGISLFLACVGLEAGTAFVDTLVNKGGFAWIGYGAIITVVPVLICAFLGKYVFKLSFGKLLGVLSGASTNPPALAFASSQDKGSDDVAVGYATVYPLTMFLRVLAAQLMILFIV